MKFLKPRQDLIEAGSLAFIIKYMRVLLGLYCYAQLIVSPTAQAANLFDIYSMARQNSPAWQGLAQSFNQQDIIASAGNAALKPQIGLTASHNFYWLDSNAAQAPALTNDQISQLNQCLIASNDYNQCLGSVASTNCVDDPACLIAQSGANQTYQSSKIGLQLKQALYQPQAYYQSRQAQTQLQKATTELQQQQQTFLLRLIETYLAALAGREQASITEQEMQLNQQQLALLEKSFESGISPASDVLYAQAMLELLQSTIEDKNRQAKQSYTNLENLIQQTIPQLASLDPNIPLPKPTPGTPEEWISIAYKKSPLLQQLTLTHEMATLEIKKRQGLRKPQLSLLAGIGTSKADTQSALGNNGDSTALNAGLELTMPLYTGGAIKAQVEEAINLESQAQNQIAQAKAQMQSDINQNFNTAAASFRQTQLMDTAIKALQLQVSNLEQGYEKGVIDAQKVLEARQKLFDTKQKKQLVRFEYIRASITLKQLAGVLNEQDIRVIGSWAYAPQSNKQQQSLFDQAKSWMSYD